MINSLPNFQKCWCLRYELIWYRVHNNNSKITSHYLLHAEVQTSHWGVSLVPEKSQKRAYRLAEGNKATISVAVGQTKEPLRAGHRKNYKKYDLLQGVRVQSS